MISAQSCYGQHLAGANGKALEVTGVRASQARRLFSFHKREAAPAESGSTFRTSRFADDLDYGGPRRSLQAFNEPLRVS